MTDHTEIETDDYLRKVVRLDPRGGGAVLLPDGRWHLFDDLDRGLHALPVSWPEPPSRQEARTALHAYVQGEQAGMEIGRRHAQRAMREALGIEGGEG